MSDGQRSGPAPSVRVRIQAADFDCAAEVARCRQRLGGGVGAIATFIGLVREQAPVAGEAVAELFLEHYPGMTEQSIDAVVAEALARWPLLDVTVIHRVGALAAADQIVYVQVAAGHRPAAFAACEFLMDYLKTDAVLWKREYRKSVTGCDRAVWIEATDEDSQRRRRWSP